MIRFPLGAGLMLVFTAGMALPSVANAITVADFDNKTYEEQAEIVAGAVEKIIRFYEQKNPNGPKLACIKNLYVPSEPGGTMPGNELVFDEIDKARKLGPGKYHVERIIFGVINRECPSTPADSSAR